MAQAVAFGSISIVDLTDLGEFSVQPMSDLPLAIVYDPNQNNFTPSWASSALHITPAIYYAGNALVPGTDAYVSVSWQRRVNTGATTNVSSTNGETVSSSGILTVNQNQLASTDSMITYIVTATYNEPTLGTTLTATGQITYSLLKNASNLKDIKITGESIFKYNTSQTITGATSITLTATASNVSISQWQYQNGSGNWVQYPNSGTGTTLTVNATDSVFFNDKCIIRVTTNDNSVYDLHTITKLRDGAPGTATVSAVLTNDDQMIPVSGGTADYAAARSQIIIYDGGDDDTANWTITSSASTGTSITRSATTTTNDTVQVTNMTTTTGTVTFTCQKTGNADIVKTFSVVKVESGADGVSPTIYSLEASALALNKTATGNVFTPSSVTFYAYQQTGGNNKTSYSGRFKIFENISLAQYDAASPKPSAAYTSTSNESSHAYTPSTSATSILCILFEAGATTTRLDTQQVVVTTDGPKGDDGDQGPAGVSIILGNYADVLSCTNDNKLMAQQVVTIPFAAYQGTSRIACSVTSVQLLGVNPSTNTSATTTSDGTIAWTLPANTSVSSASGTLSLTFTATTTNPAGTVQLVESYSWSRNTAAKDGQNAVLLQIYTPNGTNIVTDTVTSVTLQAMLLDGATDKTADSGVSWAWAKFANGSYGAISGATSSSYTVQGSTVDSYASFRCAATYGGKTYYAYFSVFDKTDPIQISVLSSIGNQIVNGQGVGALYVKVTRNGQEVDPLNSERFLTENPSSASSGDFYYKLNSTNKSVTLMRYSGSSWAAAGSQYQPTGTYTWSWRDKDGNPTTDVNNHTIVLPTSGKVIYIDGDFVDGKIIADVEVTI